MLTVIGLVLAALLVVAGLLLWIPVELVVTVRRRRRLRVEGRLSWLFGRVSRPLTRPGATPQGDAGAGEGTGRPADRERPWRGARRRRALAALRARGFAGRVLRLVRDVLGELQVRRLFLWARLGLDDPADTGMLLGVVGPLAATVSGIGGADLRVEPGFEGEVLELDGELDLRLVPGRVVGRVLAFVLSPATMRAAWAYARAGRP